MKSVSLTLNGIALLSLVLAVCLMVFLFAESRNDPSLRIAALVAGTGLVSALASISSTLLTGKDVTNKSADLPPGAKLDETSHLQVPPIDPSASKDVSAPKV